MCIRVLFPMDCFSVVTIVVSHFGIFDTKNVIQCLKDILRDEEKAQQQIVDSLIDRRMSCCILWEIKHALINVIKTVCADCYAESTEYIVHKHMTEDMLRESNVDCTFWVDNSDSCNEFWLSINRWLTMTFYSVIFIYLYTILITIIVFGCCECIQPPERPIGVMKRSFRKLKKANFIQKHLQNISLYRLPSLISENSIKIVEKNSQPMLKIKKKPIQ